MTHIIAYRDAETDMVPVSRGGVLATFDDHGQARQAAGALGVSATVRWARVVELCLVHRLGLPELDGGPELVGVSGDVATGTNGTNGAGDLAGDNGRGRQLSLFRTVRKGGES